MKILRRFTMSASSSVVVSLESKGLQFCTELYFACSQVKFNDELYRSELSYSHHMTAHLNNLYINDLSYF